MFEITTASPIPRVLNNPLSSGDFDITYLWGIDADSINDINVRVEFYSWIGWTGHIDINPDGCFNDILSNIQECPVTVSRNQVSITVYLNQIGNTKYFRWEPSEHAEYGTEKVTDQNPHDIEPWYCQISDSAEEFGVFMMR